MFLDVTVVSTNKRVWSGSAIMVKVPAEGGDMGFLPNHEPVMALLRPGTVTISPTSDTGSAEDVVFNVTQGFVSLYDNRVNIVVDDVIETK
ncbi:MAG: F0F1 ATP synthase subunit epsilon [Candidatus Ancillula sp.]|jgi:F-type H+-transporting ATPase subunit epsilon|nr:F0F1 ATP synthase subunit epsilon [Candidatus Ancillula sp.]